MYSIPWRFQDANLLALLEAVRYSEGARSEFAVGILLEERVVLVQLLDDSRQHLLPRLRDEQVLTPFHLRLPIPARTACPSEPCRLSPCHESILPHRSGVVIFAKRLVSVFQSIIEDVPGHLEKDDVERRGLVYSDGIDIRRAVPGARNVLVEPRRKTPRSLGKVARVECHPATNEEVLASRRGVRDLQPVTKVVRFAGVLFLLRDVSVNVDALAKETLEEVVGGGVAGGLVHGSCYIK